MSSESPAGHVGALCDVEDARSFDAELGETLDRRGEYAFAALRFFLDDRHDRTFAGITRAAQGRTLR
jgi:hypothetical protein